MCRAAAPLPHWQVVVSCTMLLSAVFGCVRGCVAVLCLQSSALSASSAPLKTSDASLRKHVGRSG
eukprot:4157900-Alexandrium_andersonii.AAC.1